MSEPPAQFPHDSFKNEPKSNRRSFLRASLGIGVVAAGTATAIYLDDRDTASTTSTTTSSLNTTTTTTTAPATAAS